MRVAILLHKERIRSIHLLNWPVDSSSEEISEMLGEITFPAVRTIKAEMIERNARRFRPLFALFPKLQRSDMATFQKEKDHKAIPTVIPDLVGFRSINKAYVSGTTLQRLMIKARPFLSLPKLEELDITLNHFDADLETDSKRCSADAFVLSSKRLQCLALDTNVRTVLKGVFSSSLTNLSVLSVRLPVKDLGVFINGLRSLPSLQSLFFTVRYNKTRPVVCPPLWPSDILRLRHLSIGVFTRSRVSLNSIFNIFTENDAINGLESFSLLIYGDQVDVVQPAEILQILHSLRNAREIYLRNFESRDTAYIADSGLKFPVYMPHMLHLRTEFSVIPLLIDAPFLHSLESHHHLRLP
jgi:hypothetical protein